MNTFKRIVSLFLVVCMVFCFGVSTTNIESVKAEEFDFSEGFYLIKGVGSGKYLDVMDESKENGAELQIWDRFALHQNQVFYFAPLGNYWKIISYNSHKVIEVRDSSLEDWASVGQWDYVDIACQQWSIISNSDGTVSFRNRNSGKYMDVSGNGTENGTKIIQYESNGTVAQKFELQKLYSENVHSAAWNMDISQIKTENVHILDGFINNSGYCFTMNNEGLVKVPRRSETYLEKVEYIDANTVLDIICEKGMTPSTLDQLKDLVKGEATEEIIGKILEKAGWNIPGLGIIIGTAQILCSTSDKSGDEYKKFVEVARYGKIDGSVNAIIRKTYITFIDRPIIGINNELKGREIISLKSYKYEVWDSPSQLKAPKDSSGTWIYTFE